MAFVVSLFKYLILIICFLILVAIALGLFFAIDPANPLHEAITPGAVAIAICALLFLLLNLAGIAIIISLHDRHREIAEGVDRIAMAIEKHSEKSRV